MVLDEITNEQANATFYAALSPQLALMPLGNDYSSDLRFESSGRQEEGLPFGLSPVLFFDDEDSEEEEDMDEDEGFDDMEEDYDDDFDDDFDDEDEDYEDEDEDYDYEEDVDYDDFDE